MCQTCSRKWGLRSSVQGRGKLFVTEVDKRMAHSVRADALTQSSLQI